MPGKLLELFIKTEFDKNVEHTEFDNVQPYIEYECESDDHNVHNELDSDANISVDASPINTEQKTSEKPKRRRIVGKLKQHSESNVAEMNFCDICGLKNKQKYHIVKHLMQKHKMKPNVYRCPDCNETFKSLTYLERHAVVHKKEYSTCPVCKKQFYSRNNMLRHVNETHNSERPFTCTYCKRSFSQMVNLKDHISVTHVKMPNFTCDICGKQTMTKSTLILHMDKHSGRKRQIREAAALAYAIKRKAKPFSRVCQYCGIICKSPAHHIVHLRMHTGERPYKCKICGKCFAAPNGLTTHKRIHADERPYACDLCDLTFRQRAHLRSHLIVHTGAKPYQCSFCGKTFARKGNLTTHKRMHTGEKPYECSICDGRFVELNALKRHRKVSHKL